MKSNFRNFYNSKYIFIIFQYFLPYNCLRTTGSYIQLLNSISDNCTQLQSVFQNSEESFEDESLYNNMVAIVNIIKIHLKNYGVKINEADCSVRAVALTEECKRTKHSSPLIKCHSTPGSKIGTEVHSQVDKEKKLPNSNKNETKESLGSENPDSKESSVKFMHEPKIKSKKLGNNEHGNSIVAEIHKKDILGTGYVSPTEEVYKESIDKEKMNEIERYVKKIKFTEFNELLLIDYIQALSEESTNLEADKESRASVLEEKYMKDCPKSNPTFNPIESMADDINLKIKQTQVSDKNAEILLALLDKHLQFLGKYSKIDAKFNHLCKHIEKGSPIYSKSIQVKRFLYQVNRYMTLNSIYIYFNSKYGLLNYVLNTNKSLCSKLISKSRNKQKNSTQEACAFFQDDLKDKLEKSRIDFVEKKNHLWLSKVFLKDLLEIFKLLPNTCTPGAMLTILKDFKDLDGKILMYLSEPQKCGTIEKISSDIYKFDSFEAFSNFILDSVNTISTHFPLYERLIDHFTIKSN